MSWRVYKPVLRKVSDPDTESEIKTPLVPTARLRFHLINVSEAAQHGARTRHGNSVQS